MKKVAAMLVCLAMLMISALCLADTQTYTADANGLGGAVVVEMTVDDGKITGVEVKSHNETTGISDGAIERIPEAIVGGQTLAVDTVAGATITSNAILAAAEDCAAQAGLDVAALKTATVTAQKKLTPGTYTATRHGHHSDITVEVNVTENTIESIRIVAENETSNISDTAYNTLAKQIVEKQSFGVDAVAGATYTSSAMLGAVADCMKQAGGAQAVAAFGVRVENDPWSENEITLETDVVVVGSGMAGMSAALSAQEAGADVIILEKLPYYGGISQTAGGALSYGKDKEAFVEYLHTKYNGTRRGGDHQEKVYPNTELVRAYAEYSTEAIEWLKNKGMTMVYYDAPGFPYEKQNEDGSWETAFYTNSMAVFSVSDTSFAESMGVESKNETAFDSMVRMFRENGGRLYLETPADALITDDGGAIVGVHATGKDGRYTIKAKSVILCAGGFGASEEAVEAYAPAYAGEYNVTMPSNTGDGIRMAVEIGAAVHEGSYMMGSCGQAFPEEDLCMLHPYSDNITPTTSIWINPNGLRIHKEEADCGGRSQLFVNPDSRDYYWILINEENAAASETFMTLLDEKLEEGNERFFKADSLFEIANDMRIPYSALEYTLNRYNTLCEKGEDTDHFKSAASLVAMKDGPWYAIKAYMIYFGTVGGLITDADAAVLNEAGEIIPGLYAAGENSNGGLFKNTYIGGNSIGECTTFGYIAGKKAAEYAAK